MKLEVKWIFLILVGTALGCGTVSKATYSEAEVRALDELLGQQSFEIQSDWAFPLATGSLNSISNAGLLPPGSAANRISLIGNSNYLKILGDRVEAYLPYYGERQMGGGYDRGSDAIRFEGVPKDYKVTKVAKTQGREIQFTITRSTEVFMVTVIVHPNLSTSIRVNSSQRFPIRYSGEATAISAE